MLEQKLVEKEVEVVKVEKRVIEVYHYDGKDYCNHIKVKKAIASDMAQIFNEFLQFCSDSCRLVRNTNLYTLRSNLKYYSNALKVFGSDNLDELISKLQNLKSIYSEVED